jgi:photosystem II stability/assembly factor-like uncharacterized protein
MPDVFVSYASEDHEFVAPLVKALQEANVTLWYDADSLVPGVELTKAIELGLSECKLALVVLSPASLLKSWPDTEMRLILQLERARKSDMLFPIRYNVSQAEIEAKVSILASRKAIEASEPLERIVGQVLRALGSPPVPVLPAMDFRWFLRRSGVLDTLTSVAHGTRHEVFVVGDEGTLLRSRDRGASWSRIAIDSREPLRCVVFDMAGEQGWIAGDGGTVFRSENGGDSWTRVAVDLTEDVTNIALCDGGRAVCLTVGDGSIVRLEAGSVRKIETGVKDYLWQIRFDSSGIVGCLVGGGGKVLTSSDAGESWSLAAWPVASPVYGCAVQLDRSIWAVGDEGLVWKSTDLGKTWSAVDVLTKRNPWDTWLNACDFSPSGRKGVIVGSQGMIALTLDGGDTWKSGRFQNRNELVALAFKDEDTIVATGYVGTIMTAERIWPSAGGGAGAGANMAP